MYYKFKNKYVKTEKCFYPLGFSPWTLLGITVLLLLKIIFYYYRITLIVKSILQGKWGTYWANLKPYVLSESS